MTDKLHLDPKTSALLVMDFQTAILEMVPADKDPLLARTARLIEAARKARMMVAYVVVGFRPGYPEASPRNLSFGAIRGSGRFVEGSAGSEVHPAVAPKPGEVIVTKHRVSAFAGTDLAMVLRAGGIENARPRGDRHERRRPLHGPARGRRRLPPRGRRGLLRGPRSRGPPGAHGEDLRPPGRRDDRGRDRRGARVAGAVRPPPPPFPLAGLALFGLVLDEIDVPHDNLEGIVTLCAGALAGLVAGALALRFSSAPRLARLAAIAWDAVRYVLAFEMVRYGLAKVVGMQFYPQYWTLDRRVVNMHPMSLVWAFFGRSYGYQLAGGIVELGSAVLLCFRRTTLLGACLLATALTNVVLVNVFYDVYVKLMASLYLVLDVSLIARDAPRLWAAFFPTVERRADADRGRVLGGVLVALVLGVPASEILRDAVRHGVFHRDLLEGAWTVESRAGLDDFFPGDPGPWDEVYFEKERAGSNPHRHEAHPLRGGRQRSSAHADAREVGSRSVAPARGHVRASRQGAPLHRQSRRSTVRAHDEAGLSMSLPREGGRGEAGSLIDLQNLHGAQLVGETTKLTPK